MVGPTTLGNARVESVTRAILGHSYDHHYQYCLSQPAGARYANERTGKLASGSGVDYIVRKGDSVTCLSCGARWACENINNGPVQWEFLW